MRRSPRSFGARSVSEGAIPTIKFQLSSSPGCAGSFRKETELPVSHKGGDDVAEESPVSEPWEEPSEAAILLKIESLDSGLTVLSRPGKGPSHTSETSLVPSRERTPRKPVACPSHKSSFSERRKGSGGPGTMPCLRGPCAEFGLDSRVRQQI